MQMNPIIVIAYDENSRKSLVNSLAPSGAQVVPCETFCEAELLMLDGLYQGILVDLASMIKAKGEEKIVACSLTGFFPTLRVKTMGGMIVPMAMPGDVKQDKSLGDFLKRTSADFTPRRLRTHKRRDLCVPTVIGSAGSESAEIRGCTLNIGWGGMFIVDMFPERFEVDQILKVAIPDASLELETRVIWINPWGGRRTPGIGVSFTGMEGNLAQLLTSLLRTSRESDRDRLVA